MCFVVDSESISDLSFMKKEGNQHHCPLQYNHKLQLEKGGTSRCSLISHDRYMKREILIRFPDPKKISSQMSWWEHTFSDANWNNPVQKLVQNPFNTDVNSLPRPIKLMYDSSAKYSFESKSIQNSWTKYFSIDPKAFHHFLFLVLIYARLFSKLLLYQKCKSQVTCVVLTAHWTFKLNFRVCRGKRYRPSN